jgi:hypothetical protein
MGLTAVEQLGGTPVRLADLAESVASARAQNDAITRPA